MDAIVAQYDGTRGYQPNSQDFGQRGSRHQISADQHALRLHRHRSLRCGTERHFRRLRNETGNPCRPRRRIACASRLPEEKLWPIDDEYFQYQDGGGFHQMTEFVKTGCAHYGDFAKPDLAGRTEVENYASSGQLLGAMQYRADAEPGSGTNGTKRASSRPATRSGPRTTRIRKSARAFPSLTCPSRTPPLYYLAHGNKAWHVAVRLFRQRRLGREQFVRSRGKTPGES